MRAPPTPVPYKRTSVFDENTLPAALRREHRTKPGVWSVIRVLDGRMRMKVEFHNQLPDLSRPAAVQRTSSAQHSDWHPEPSYRAFQPERLNHHSSAVASLKRRGGRA